MIHLLSQFPYIVISHKLKYWINVTSNLALRSSCPKVINYKNEYNQNYVALNFAKTSE